MNDPLTSTHHLFFVDDDLDDCEQISHAFSEIHSRENLFLFTSGESMLEYLIHLPNPSHYPSLIVLDYHLHGMNGEEVLEYLKQNKLYRQIPVLIYSSELAPTIKERLTHLGAKYYYQKITSLQGLLQFARALKMLCEQSVTFYHKSQLDLKTYN